MVPSRRPSFSFSPFQIHSNGYISLSGSQSVSTTPVIQVFLTDVDTTGIGDISYRQVILYLSLMLNKVHNINMDFEPLFCCDILCHIPFVHIERDKASNLYLPMTLCIVEFYYRVCVVIFNSRCTCAVRITVLDLCVCLTYISDAVILHVERKQHGIDSLKRDFICINASIKKLAPFGYRESHRTYYSKLSSAELVLSMRRFI